MGHHKDSREDWTRTRQHFWSCLGRTVESCRHKIHRLTKAWLKWLKPAVGTWRKKFCWLGILLFTLLMCCTPGLVCLAFCMFLDSIFSLYQYFVKLYVLMTHCVLGGTSIYDIAIQMLFCDRILQGFKKHIKAPQFLLNQCESCVIFCIIRASLLLYNTDL